MIIVAGGSGSLGSALVPRLVAAGHAVRVISRDPDRVAASLPPGVEVTAADVRDSAAVDRALEGGGTVISAITGFGGREAGGAGAIDRDGNRALIAAALTHGVEHFVLMSVAQASADHPIELFRMKYAAEQELRASGLVWTIVRPTAYMETWVGLVGGPILETGRTRIFGTGDNPINFVSARDVAALVEEVVAEPGFRGQIVEIGGPEDLTLNQVVSGFEAVVGRTAARSHVPRPMMRAMSIVLRPLNPVMAAQIQAGVVMDSRDMRFDSVGARGSYASLSSTSLDEMIRRDYGALSPAGA